MLERLQSVDPRFVLLALAGVLAVALAGAYSLVFDGSIREFMRIQALKTASQEAVSVESTQSSGTVLAQARAAVETLEERLYGRAPQVRAVDMVSHIIRQLDGLSLGNEVGLLSVKPGDPAEVVSFAEIPFDVEVEGEYAGLIDWLRQVEVELRPMMVKQFHLRPVATGEGLLMTLRVVSYRAPGRP